MNTAADTTFDGLDDFDTIVVGRPNFLAAAADYAARPQPRRMFTKAAPSALKLTTPSKLEAFSADHPEVISWLAANPNFGFAVSLSAGLARYGSLTEGQVGAVHKCLAREADRLSARQAAPAAAQAVSVAGAGFVSLGAALLKAKASGLKNPAIIFEAVTFKLAKVGGSNTGSIYATSGKAYGSTYFGKINEAGTFQPARDCTPEIKVTIAAICADPLGQIVAHGKKTGNCACCGRELTDENSVARGIGPVCFERYFG